MKMLHWEPLARYLMFILLGFVVISGCISGCGSGGSTHEAVTPEVPVVKDTSRLEFVDHKSAGSWEWRILRDKKTEKEWLVIHDTYRMVVVPFDGNVGPQQVTEK